jgi:hypothetical protein
MTVIKKRTAHKKSLVVLALLLGSHQLYSGPLNLMKGAFNSTVSAAQNAAAFVGAAVPMNPFTKKTTSDNVTESTNQQTLYPQPMVPNPIAQQQTTLTHYQQQQQQQQQPSSHRQSNQLANPASSPSAPCCPNFCNNLKAIVACIACRNCCNDCCTKCGDYCSDCANSCGNCCNSAKHSCAETCICERDKDCCFCACQCGGWIIPLGCCCNCKDDNN